MAEQFGIRLSVSPADLAASINNAIKQINSGNSLDKVKIGADTSELESAIKRIKSEIVSITGRNNTSKIKLGTSRADGQATLEELSALRKAEESLANPVGIAAIQSEFNKTAEIVRNLTSAISTLKTEYLSIGEVNPVGNTGVPIDTNAISEKIKTAVSGLNITKPVEIPISFKNVQEAVAALQQQVNGTVINFGNSTLNGAGANTGDTVSNAVKQVAEQATEALKQQAQVEKEAANAARNNSTAIAEQTRAIKENENAYKIRNTVMANGDTSKAVTYGDSSKNSTYNYKNGELVSRTDIENFAQQRKEMEKNEVAAIKLKTALDDVKASYSSANAPKPITDAAHLDELNTKYNETSNAIDKIRNSTESVSEATKAKISSMIEDIKRYEREYRNAEYVGNQLREKTVGVVSAQELNNFDAFTSKIGDIRVLTPDVTAEINTLKEALKNVSSKEELVNILNQLDVFKSKINASTAQVKSADSMMKELAVTMKSLNKISNNTALYKNKDIEEVKALSGSVNQLKTDCQALMDSLNKDGSSANLIKIREQMTGLKEKTAEATAESDKLVRSFGRVKIDDNNLKKVNQLIAQMEEYMRRNQAAMGKTNTATGSTYGDEIRAFISQLQTAGTVGDVELQKIANGFANIKYQIKAANLEGITFWGELKAKATKFIKWTAMTLVITKARMYFRQLFTTVYELDGALIDLRKTFKSNNEELEAFYFESNKIAKQLGVTTKEIIAQASAWSRLGFSTKEQASKMAEYSAMFKGISPGMDMDTATDGLVSVMKAFKIGLDNVDEVVDGIMSKINIVGNTRAVDNTDIVNFLTRSSAAMAEANNTLEDTIAIGTAITEITRDASNAGQVMKTVSMRIRGYDEETEAYTNDVEELSGKIADLTKTASTPGGISLFKDTDKTTFKSTREILGDISKIYDQLTDKQQAGLLEALAGKRNGQAVAAVLTNYEAVEDALSSMANSAGSAEKELAVYQESAEYLFNQFKETFTSIAQHAIKRDDLKNLIKFGTSMLEIVDGIVSKIGLLPAILTTVVGVISSKKALQHNFLGFNVNDGKFGMNFLGAQVGKGWSAQRVAIKAQASECKVALNDLYMGMVNNEQESAKFQAAFTKAMSSNSAAVQTFAQKAKQGTATIRDMTAASNALGGVGGKLKSIGAGIGNTLISMGTAMIVSAVFNKIIESVSNSINMVKNLSSELNELDSDYDGIVSEISQLNEQLTETQSKIAELEKLPKLTFLQKEELEALKKYNDELERQRKQRENEAEANRIERYQKAQKLFDDLFYSSTYSSDGMKKMTGDEETKKWYSESWKFWKAITRGIKQSSNETMSAQEDALIRYKHLLGVSEIYQKRIDEHEDDPSESKNVDKWQKDKEEMDDEIKKLKVDITGYVATWRTILNDLNLFDDHDEHTQKAIDYLQGLVDEWDKITGAIPNTLGGVLEKFGSVKQYLIDLAEKGELTADAFERLTEKDVKGIDEFRKALENVEGLPTVDDVIESIYTEMEKLKKKTDDTTESLKGFAEILDIIHEKVDDTISKQEKLAEAFKKIGLGAKLSAKEIYDLFKEVPEIAKYIQQDGKEFTISQEGFRAANRELYKEIQEGVTQDLLNAKDQKNMIEKITKLYDEQIEFTKEHGAPLKSIQDEYSKLIEEYKAKYNPEDPDALTKNIDKTIKEVDDSVEGLSVIHQLMNDLFDEKQMVIDSINAGFDEAKSKVDDFNKDIKTLDSAIKTLNGNTLLSYEELNELLEIDHNLEYEAFDDGYSISIDALEELRKKSYETRNDYIDDLMDTAKAELETAKTTKATYQEKCGYINEYGEFVSGTLSDIKNAAEKMAAEEQVNIANAQISALEEVIKKLEALQGKITYDDDNKKLSDEMQNRIDYYNTIISAIEIMRDKYSEAFEKEKEALEGEKNALEEGKKALKEANDERDRELKLIEARNNLENAKKRKVWVYSEGEGFKQVADQKAIKEAEEEYRDAITDVQEAEIDKKIDELDQKIKENEKQQEAFEKSHEDMTNLEQNIEDAKTVEQAKAALGLTDEKDLLNLSDTVKEGIKNGLAEAIIEKDNEENKDKTDKNGNSLYTPVTLDDVLQSLGATVTAEDLKAMKNELPTEAVYNAAVKGLSDSLKEFTENAVNSSVVNNGGIVVSPTFNIYDAGDPNNIAKVVNSEITNLLTRYNNSIK